MEKMTIERFNEICSIIKGYYDKMLSGEFDDMSMEDYEKFEEEYMGMMQELKGSDLSDIPAEAWSNYVPLLEELDFEGTGANIDFNYINFPEQIDRRNVTIKLKGCNVKNFSFDLEQHDFSEESFDEELVEKAAKEHPEAFLGRTIENPEIRAKYNKKELTLVDVVEHGLGSIVTEKHLEYQSKAVVKKIGLEEALKIDIEILSTPLLMEMFGTVLYDVESKEDYDLEKVKAAIIESAKSKLTNTYSFKKEYTKFMEVPYIKNALPEHFVDFPEGMEELKEKFLSQKITIEDVIKHKEIFFGKKFLIGMDDDKNISYYHKDLREEQIEYLVENEEKAVEFLMRVNPYTLISIAERMDLDKSQEERSTYVREEITRFVKENMTHLDFSDRSLYEFIDYKDVTLSLISNEYERRYVEELFSKEGTIDTLIDYGVSPKDLENGDLAIFFTTYGLDRIIEFDRENGGFFSENGFARGKVINDAFFHYAGNTHDYSRTIYTNNLNLRTNTYRDDGGYSEDYSKEAFEESVRRMIVYGPTDWNYTDKPLDHRNMQGPFRDSHPELFVSPEMPDKWQDMFYAGKVDFEAIKDADESEIGYIKEIMSKERELAFRRVEFHFDIGKVSEDVLFEIIRENGNYLCKAENLDFEGKSHDEALQVARDGITNSILSGRMPYGPKAPNYVKDSHPELFLDENAPEELQLMFYKRYQEEVPTKIRRNETMIPRLSVETLEKHPEYIEFLDGKTLTHAYLDESLATFIQVFGQKEFFDLLKQDPESMRIIADRGRSGIARFKKILDERPEFYAKKELEESDGYTKDEIEEIVSGNETTNERILEGRRLLESKKAKFRDFIITSPGYVIHCPDEKLDDFKFTEYRELLKLSKFDVSDNYRRDTAEQIIASMYSYLGYSGSKEVLKLPEVDEQELEEAIRTTGVAISGIYENVYTVKGNLKVIEAVFDKLEPSLPGGKARMNVYKSINQKLEEGFSGSIEELIKAATEENGIKFDEGRIRNISKQAISSNAQYKMSLIKGPFESFLAENLVETPENIKILIDTYSNALKKSLLDKESIDIEYIKAILEKEYSRTREDGTTFYSPHVTDHLNDLLRFTDRINNDPEYARINQSVVDVLKDEKEKIGKGWIRKALDIKSRLTEQEYVALQTKLYGPDSAHKIDADRNLELKDKSEAGIEEAYVVLKELELPGVFTFEKGEIMFAGLSTPYSEEFKSFFFANMTEILRKPEYYTEFQVMHRRMETVIKDPNIYARYKSGRYTVKELLDDIRNITYDNVEPGYFETAYRAKKSNLSQAEFNKAKEVYDKMKEREKQAVPPVASKSKRFVGRILRIDDPLTLTIGNVTTCCQRFGEGQPGESSMLHSALEENGSVFVVEEVDENGEVVGIVSQSWTWRNGDRVCFDNVEIPNTLESELVAKDAHREIFEVYQDAAKRMIEVDKKALGKMLAEGKITQEQYDALIIKEVTVGRGCDDLIKHLPKDMSEKLVASSGVKPVEYGRVYTGINSRQLYVDSTNQSVVARNEDYIEDIKHRKAPEDVSIGYTRIRDINRKKGVDIHQDLVQRVKNMNDRAGENVKMASVLARQESNAITIITREYGSGLYGKDLVLSISESDDWYLLASENDSEIKIEDSLLLSEMAKTDYDKSLSKLEYARELLGLARIASSKGKPLVVDLERESKFLDIEKLASLGIIHKDSRGAITVQDKEKLNELIQNFDSRITKEKEEMMVDTAIVKGTEDESRNDDENR